VGRDRTFDQGDPRVGVRFWRHAQAGGVTTPLSFFGLTKTRGAPRVFLFCVERKHYRRHCLRQTPSVCARELATKLQSNFALKRRGNPSFLSGKGGLLRFARNDGGRGVLRHHQHVEHDDRRHCQDHRPDADGPQNILGAKTLLSGNGVVVFEMHDAALRFLLLLPS
jgi:hypothetical protein